jgi:hypothetical protein
VVLENELRSVYKQSGPPAGELKMMGIGHDSGQIQSQNVAVPCPGSNVPAKEDVEFFDNRGFASSSSLCRQPQMHKGCPKGGSDAEYSRVIASGGRFIDQAGILGRNVEGNKDIIVPPMAPGERLVSVNPGKSASTSAALIGAAKELSMLYGKHDVANCAAWEVGGEVLPSISGTLTADCPMARALFCDNLTIFTKKPKASKNGDTDTSGERGPSPREQQQPIMMDTSTTSFCLQSGRSCVYQLMTNMGFEVQRPSQMEGCDRSNVFFLCLCPTARDSNFYKWKVSLADVPIERVRLICDMLQLAANNRDVKTVPNSIYDEFKTGYAGIIEQLGISQGKFFMAFEAAQKIHFCDIDLSYDLPGTLNAVAFQKEVEGRGLEVNKGSRCGINCVRTCEFKVGALTASIKAYNKIFETMQQGSARSNEITCKTGYLLNPSTKHLREVLQSADYNQNGVTRFECTFISDQGQIPDFDEMYEFLADYKAMLNPATLVVSSVQNHIELMESFVQRSIVVYYPDLFELKKNEWASRTCKKRDNYNKILKQNLNEIPDGVLIRYSNTSTGKFNGYILQAQFSGRADREVTGWDLVARSLAWGTSCQHNPSLFVCVAGALQLSEKESRTVNMYFRQVEIEKLGPENEMATYLAWHCTFDRGNHKNLSTDWGLVGVDKLNLKNLKFQCIEREVKPSFNTMGKLDIKVANYTADDDITSHASSETREAISGLTNRYYDVSQHNGALNTWVNWIKYKICEQGRARTKKIRFLVGQDWFWIPVGTLNSEIIKYLEENDTDIKQTIVSVRMNGNNLEWCVADSSRTHKIQGRCKGARALPVDAEPIKIEGGGAQSTGKGDAWFVCTIHGRFFLPQSIREQLERYMKDKGIKNSIDDFITNLQLLHTSSTFGRVPNMKNSEEYMSILDADGNCLASNMDAGSKRPRLQ